MRDPATSYKVMFILWAGRWKNLESQVCTPYRIAKLISKHSGLKRARPRVQAVARVLKRMELKGWVTHEKGHYRLGDRQFFEMSIYAGLLSVMQHEPVFA